MRWVFWVISVSQASPVYYAPGSDTPPLVSDTASFALYLVAGKSKLKQEW